METPKPKTDHIEIGVVFLLAGVGIFCAVFFYFNIVMAIMKLIFYSFVIIMIGGAIYQFKEAINKNKTARRIKSGTWFTIKKIIFPLALVGMTAWYYYIVCTEGIRSFHHPIVGILIGVALTFICLLYFWFFIRKHKTKIPIGK